MDSIQVVTVDEVKAYLGIDYEDHFIETNIDRLITTADNYLQGAIGQGYPRDDSRAKELALLIISDLYDNRELTSKVSANARRLVDSMMLQMRIELRKDDEDEDV